MHLLVTVGRPAGSAYHSTFAPLVRELFPASGTMAHGRRYFVRTQDRPADPDRLVVSLGDVADPAATTAAVQRAAADHGCVAQVTETPLEALPSPLGNAGFGGPDFPLLSKALYQDAAPMLVSFLETAGQDPLRAAVGAIRLMIAHTRATLIRSSQRELAGYSFDDLLTLRLLSFRSHFEGIYPRTKNPESFEAACAKFYAQVGQEARDTITACGDPDVEQTGDPVAAAWSEFIASRTDSLAADFRNGTVVNAGRTLEDLVKEHGPVEPTRFHTSTSPELQYLLHRDVDFLTYRLHTSLLYSCLFTLGFSLAERYVFCYVAARANEEVSGRTTQELRAGLHELAGRLAAANTAGVV